MSDVTTEIGNSYGAAILRATVSEIKSNNAPVSPEPSRANFIEEPKRNLLTYGAANPRNATAPTEVVVAATAKLTMTSAALLSFIGERPVRVS